MDVFNFMEKFKKYESCRIMVVDDEEFCIASIETMLSSLHIDTQLQVDFCINGKEAIEMQ